MLTDITPIPCNDAIFDFLSNGRPNAVRLAQGIYQMWHWNPERFFKEKLTDADGWDYSAGRTLEQNIAARQARRACIEAKYGEDYPYCTDYGVCDNLEQVLERWPHLVEEDTPYVVIGVEIRRENQPPGGGWRYHKWGEYIGTQDPQHEYLYHDTHIDAVWTFHIYRVIA